MSKFKENLETVISVMADSFEKDIIDENQDAILKIKSVYDADEKRFFDTLESANFKMSTLVHQIINIPRQKNYYILEHVTSGLYEHFFKRLMELKEGSACCADKSRFITRMTLKALKENTDLALYADYSQCEQIKEDKERQAYWSPKTIKDTDMAMKLFWDWYLLRFNMQ